MAVEAVQVASPSTTLMSCVLGAATCVGDIRLLQVTGGLHSPVRFLCCGTGLAGDVIHSMSSSSGGLKADLLPGRSVGLVVAMWFGGVLSGMCAELCGSFHGMMPWSAGSVC